MVSQNVAAPQREKDPKKRVVITGMGLVSVFGSDIDVFYNKLLEGESGISLIDRFDASSFPVRFGGQIRDFSSQGYIDCENDRRLDDCSRYCLVAGKRALEDANLGYEALNIVSKKKIGSWQKMSNFVNKYLVFITCIFRSRCFNVYFIFLTDGQNKNGSTGGNRNGRCK